MDSGTLAVMLTLAGTLLVVATAVRIVPQGQVGVVKRLGHHYRTMDPGLHLLVPFVDQVQAIVDLREQILTPQPVLCITADDARMAVDVTLYSRVVDPVRVTTEFVDHRGMVTQLAIFTLRSLLGELPLHQALASYHQLGERTRTAMADRARTWGIDVSHVEIRPIEPAP